MLARICGVGQPSLVTVLSTVCLLSAVGSALFAPVCATAAPPGRPPGKATFTYDLEKALAQARATGMPVYVKSINPG